jgi:hypothetical protein
MYIQLGTGLVLAAFAASVVLVFDRRDRVAPIIAVIASGLSAAIVLGIVSISSTKFRIDLILPAVLVVAAAVCWGRAAAKATVTAAAVVFVIGLIQVLGALRVVG